MEWNVASVRELGRHKERAAARQGEVAEKCRGLGAANNARGGGEGGVSDLPMSRARANRHVDCATERGESYRKS